ncbi:hypothetical protein [Lacticaseibacillus jixiensis]|uniref:hypothetical protein n=1 Tax=Lacticaseibacillus jixiensis TaxID=3231926 RepID=UPI0036F2E641
MADLLAGFAYWIITHGPTCAGLLLAFLLGCVFEMWMECSGKEKESQSSGVR